MEDDTYDSNGIIKPFKTITTKIKGGPPIDKKLDHVGTCKKMKIPNPYNYDNNGGFIAGSDNPYPQ